MDDYRLLVRSYAERLLLWMSELGAGPWARFRRIAGSLPSDESLHPGRIARGMSEAGYVEFDWTNKRWSVAPPTLVTIPGLPNGALLAGARTSELCHRMEALQRGEADNLDVWVDVRHPARGRPSASVVRPVYVLGRARADIEEAASWLGIGVSYHPAKMMARNLASLPDHLSSWRLALPPPDSTISTFDPDTLSWVAGRADVDSGTVRQYDPEQGATRFLLDDDEGLRAVDRSWGMYAALARADRHVLRWRPASDVNGELLVPISVPLPDLHARTARLCSGLQPSERPLNNTPCYEYVNVPEHVSDGIAESLGQRLRTSPRQTTT